MRIQTRQATARATASTGHEEQRLTSRKVGRRGRRRGEGEGDGAGEKEEIRLSRAHGPGVCRASTPQHSLAIGLLHRLLSHHHPHPHQRPPCAPISPLVATANSNSYSSLGCRASTLNLHTLRSSPPCPTLPTDPMPHADHIVRAFEMSQHHSAISAYTDTPANPHRPRLRHPDLDRSSGHILRPYGSLAGPITTRHLRAHGTIRRLRRTTAARGVSVLAYPSRCCHTRARLIQTMPPDCRLSTYYASSSARHILTESRPGHQSITAVVNAKWPSYSPREASGHVNGVYVCAHMPTHTRAQMERPGNYGPNQAYPPSICSLASRIIQPQRDATTCDHPLSATSSCAGLGRHRPA